jgi:Arc/MetJ-type ribon-helix-helix transcriptional regulator
MSMKKKLYTRPVSVVLSVEMYHQISELTEQREISVSDYIREALQEKLASEKATMIIKQEG